MTLSGQRALVTGGGRGIGRSVVLALASEGAEVALAARTAAEVQAVATEAQALGVRAHALSVDVSDPASVARLFEAAREAMGGIDIVVGAAGIAPSAPLTRTDDATWHAVIETNLSGTFYCLRAALPEMVERRQGRFVAMASIASKTGARYISAYTASKHGVLGLVRCAALEVAEHGVTVNAVCPGYVDTPMTDAAIANVVARTGRSEAEVRQRLQNESPQGRFVTPDEVARLTLFLCSDGAAGINGQGLNVDGGTVL